MKSNGHMLYWLNEKVERGFPIKKFSFYTKVESLE
jgi:hypothetical protein